MQLEFSMVILPFFQCNEVELVIHKVTMTCCALEKHISGFPENRRKLEDVKPLKRCNNHLHLVRKMQSVAKDPLNSLYFFIWTIYVS